TKATTSHLSMRFDIRPSKQVYVNLYSSQTFSILDRKDFPWTKSAKTR
ncbi:MAG: hypothetical protein ACI90V_012726, partial [Bacillariaceae sp.]